MAIMRFNAITYASRLKEAGMLPKLAEVQAEELSNLINNDIATKKDLYKLKDEVIIKLGTIVVSCTFVISLMIGTVGFFVK